MICALCGSAKVTRLPPSQISPHPGYECNACGTKMRAPGMIWLYLFVLVFGTALSGLFAVLLWKEGIAEFGLRILWLIGIGVVCVGYSVMQIMRPAARREKPDRKP